MMNFSQRYIFCGLFIPNNTDAHLLIPPGTAEDDVAVGFRQLVPTAPSKPGTCCPVVSYPRNGGCVLAEPGYASGTPAGNRHPAPAEERITAPRAARHRPGAEVLPKHFGFLQSGSSRGGHRRALPFFIPAAFQSPERAATAVV